jgi:hypothetical protein
LFAGIERYRLISLFFPDTYWGAIFAICGISLLFPLPLLARQIAHSLLCAVWSGVAVLSLMAIITPPTLLIASVCLFPSVIHALEFLAVYQLSKLS